MPPHNLVYLNNVLRLSIAFEKRLKLRLGAAAASSIPL